MAEPSPTFAAGAIRVRGARAHNLRGIDVEIPRQQLTVITGVSGSGKSSLALDTIHAEGQRRYLESLAATTRGRVAAWQRPDVDVIDGLPPTISVGQSAAFASLRSTLATTTEILDYLRLLFARCGQTHCPSCCRPLSVRSVSEIVDQILAFKSGSKVLILAPLVRDQRGSHRDVFETVAKSGLLRCRVDGNVVEITPRPNLAESKPRTIEAVVDRVVVKNGLRARLRESVELALKLGQGSCIISELSGAAWIDRGASNRFACTDCGLSFAELEPRSFSFNSPHGACLACRGLGVVVDSDSEDDAVISARQSEHTQLCMECGGSRLNSFANRVSFRETTLPDLLAKTVGDAAATITEWQTAAVLRTSDAAVARVLEHTLPAVQNRLDFLTRVGADYLTLDRPTRTLSGGEFQRARLAACLGSGLTGVCYVLDEPTVGLHPRDTAAMLATLHDLRGQGNTLVVVEHDPDVMRHADHLIDLGPGAGAEGGQVVAVGTPDQIAVDEKSVTGKYLSSRSLVSPSILAIEDGAHWLTLSRVTVHNLCDVDVRIPIGKLTVVTGVSGSGKTSLVHHALVPAVKTALQKGSTGRIQLAGYENLRRLVEVTQSPLGRSPASNPATYSGIWDDVCRLFAQTREARLRGFRASRFRFNSPAGRCAACRGRGVQRVRWLLLPDAFVTCPTCRGERFNSATLMVRFRGLTTANVLRLRINEAAAVLANHARIAAVLKTFDEVGLGYLRLGQSATTLSGGEAQRVKLATELSRQNVEPTLFVLDEPTTGLHPADVERLLSLLRRIVAAGHTVVVIEHHLRLIAGADWIIDLGPDGGSRGGRVLVQAPPSAVAQCRESHTGRALARLEWA